ncbi:MAG: hypothetical protein ACI3W7_05805 [Oscillospiraceae bacterium]
MGRVDGRRVKGEVPMYLLAPQFMTKRNDAMNMTTVDIPIEPMRRYMNAKRKEGYHISHMALIMTAYAHLVGEYPSINRFIQNRRVYEHNDFSVSLVVLRPGNTGNDDTMAKLYFQPEDTVFDVQRKIDEYIEKNASGAEEDKNGLDKVMGFLCSLGGLVDIIGVILRFMDRHGWLPRFLVDVSPFHASLLITNLASIRTNHIYHHVYNFGTTSVSIAMGNLREVPKRGKDGSVELVRCMPLGVVMDERIASGHYLALAFARMKDMLAHPEQLEQPGTRQAALGGQS